MRDLTRPTEMHSPGHARIMAVYAAVVRFGPIGLDQAMRATGLPRSATWRCLTTLETEGWVRRRLGETRFVVSGAALTLGGAADGVQVLLDRVLPALAEQLRGARLSADVAALAGPGRIAVLETNRRDPGAPEGFLTSPLTLALLMVVSPEERLAHVRAALAEAKADEASTVTSGRFTRTLAQAAEDGLVWDPLSGALCLPFVGETGVLALRLEGAGTTQRSRNRLLGVAETLRRALPDLMPDADQIARLYWPARSARNAE